MKELISQAKETIPTVDSILEEVWRELGVDKRSVTKISKGRYQVVKQEKN